MFFSPKEKISHIYQKIINLWNAKTFHNHLDKPIFHPNKKFLILTQRKSCKRKKFWHPPERTNFLLKLKNLLYLAEKVTNFLYLPEKKKISNNTNCPVTKMFVTSSRVPNEYKISTFTSVTSEKSTCQTNIF